MSGAVILYLVGMALVFAGQRLFGGGDAVEWGVTGAGEVAVLVSLGLLYSARNSAATDRHRAAYSSALKYAGLGLVSICVYGLSTEYVTDMIGLDDEALKRWTVCFQALWPILWLAGTLPLIAVDLAIQDSPKVLQPIRVQRAAENWLAVALGLALVFPVNYLASEHNERWDLAYFKTTSAGTATVSLIENLDQPLQVRIFQSASSDVTPELVGYFQALEGPNLSFEVLDHAAEPALTEELKVRDNGYVALTLGEDTKSWKVGTELDKSKKNLKKFDAEFHQRVIELAQGKQVAYLTTGHGEMNWRNEDDVGRKLSNMKKLLEVQALRVKELGLTQGLGDAVPEDARVVIIMAPTEPFLDAEIESLKAYLARGGGIFIAVEPDGEPLDDLLAALGLKRGEGTLASEKSFIPITRELSDRINVVTNRFSSHDSTSTLSKNSRALSMATPSAGWLEELDGFEAGTVTTTIRSLNDNWADLDGDLEFDEETEAKKIRPLAVVSSGEATAPEEGGETHWRATVIGDATAFSDMVIGSVKGNQVFLWDSVRWLAGAEGEGGEVESEEDVKIQHTREDQQLWFYGTILGVPALVLLIGVLRVRARRKGGE